MPSNKNPTIQRIVSNSDNHKRQYYFAALLLLIAIIILDFLIYCYLLQVQKGKQEAFVEGSGISISNLITHDLKLIFDQSQNLNKLSIVKNYSQTNKIDRSYNIVGNVIYVNRDSRAVIVDLQPITSLISSILTDNFYYKIDLNNNALLSNTEDREFLYIKKYQINAEHFLIIKLSYKPISLYLENYSKTFQDQYLTMILISLLFFLLLIPILCYLIRAKERFQTSNDKIAIINEAFKLNINYIKECRELEQNDILPIRLEIVESPINQIDLASLIEEIQVYARAYTARCHYKFELNLVSEVDYIRIKFNPIIFKQIIVSLLHNILYFMRGGAHIKKCLVKFEEDRITFIYDSFFANEEHMQNWSGELFQHLVNPYILDCRKIFQSIKDCNFTYEVKPNQGKNEVIIFLNQKEALGRVIKFKKK